MSDVLLKRFGIDKEPFKNFSDNLPDPETTRVPLLDKLDEHYQSLQSANITLSEQLSVLKASYDKLDKQLKVQQDANVKLTEQYNQMKKDSDLATQDARRATILSAVSILIAIASLLLQFFT